MIFSRCGSTLADIVAAFSGAVPPTEHVFDRWIISSVDDGDTVSETRCLRSEGRKLLPVWQERGMTVKSTKLKESVNCIPIGVSFH